MNNKIKNILKITIFSGIFLGTVVLLSGSEIKREETITLSNYEKNNTSKDSVLTLEAVKLLGWDKKTNITLSEGLTTIHDNSFLDLIELKKIVIPSTVTSIGPNSFSNTASLMDITMSFSFQGNNNPKYGFTQEQWDVINWVYVPSDATNITNEVLKSVGFDKKEIITFEDWATYLPNAQNIATKAMNFWGILTYLEIPAGIETIGVNALDSTPALKNIIFSPDSKLHTIEPRGIARSGVISLKLPNSIVNLQYHSLIDNKYLTSLILPNQLTFLENNLLQGASSLEEIIIPESVTKIGQSVFEGSTKLKKIIIPEAVTSIGGNVFSGTTSLNDIQMNVKFKTATPSYGFTQEQWDVIKWTYTAIADEILTQENIGLLNWGEKTTITLNDWKEMAPNITTINSAFLDNINLTYIEIPKSILNIEFSSFKNTESLSEIMFEQNSQLQFIGNEAFFNSALKSIEIPSGVILIGDSAFKDTKFLKDIRISNNLENYLDHFGFTDIQWNSIVWTPVALNVKFISLVTSLGFLMIIQIFFVIYSSIKIKNFDV